MDCLRIKVNEYGYKEKDRIFKRKFITGINKDYLMNKMMRELPQSETNEVIHQQVLAWTKEVGHKRSWKSIIAGTKESKDFNAMENKSKRTINLIEERQAE